MQTLDASSPCMKHPHQPLVGVCAACLRERLAICMGRGGRGGGWGGEAEPVSNEALGSSIMLSKGIGNGSPMLREGDKGTLSYDKRTLSYYLKNLHGVPSNCNNVHASHRKAMSSDAIYQGHSFYGAHSYVARDEGSYLKAAKVHALPTKEAPDVYPKGRPLSWLSAFFSKSKEKQKATSQECSIAPWRGCEGAYHSCTHTLSSEAAPSWEQLSPLGKTPTMLSSLPSSQSTRTPFKLPPPLISAHATRPSLMITAPLTSQSTRSPLKLAPLRISPGTPLRLPPLLSYPRSPIKLPTLFGSKPTSACDVSAQEEGDQRSGHGTPSLHSKRREIWLGILLRNKWVVRFKRHFIRKKKPEDADSVRTSSARESDYSCRQSQNHCPMQARHSQNHWFTEKNHFQNQRSPMLNRPSARAGREGEQRWGSASGREYAGWESYFSSSFNGLHVRHRYHSADSADQLLRFYLTPINRSTCRFRSHHYYY